VATNANPHPATATTLQSRAPRKQIAKPYGEQLGQEEVAVAKTDICKGPEVGMGAKNRCRYQEYDQSREKAACIPALAFPYTVAISNPTEITPTQSKTTRAEAMAHVSSEEITMRLGRNPVSHTIASQRTFSVAREGRVSSERLRSENRMRLLKYVRSHYLR
jgi:hypothetical protein